MTQTIVNVADVPARFDELLRLAAEGEVIVTDQTGARARLLPLPAPAGGRVPGLHAGKVHIADDFNAPLPDEFWAGSP